ncbi:MBL fold metallo-hydrolase [Amycolatopsis rhizosphaerae]|uniref:MBL fold metallo-hydrolase n=1 Tax=Amycolatopsis rhizosphaerae TaxID=2053003 RepID=A0A558CPF2_9PSEU|nr:MBL fold metallo-hydrolase [Amycolatopsis rhizosphaerae]TVT50552.1 MBL fold metallo-hydrolase [Amycolatopsis rhizosphaerae]
MTLPVCATCGMQYAAPRPDCPICEDDRQWVPATGQQWTDLETLRAGEYAARVEDQGPGIIGLGCEPRFAIGQRALLVKAESGNFLWDCVPYLDDELIGKIRDLGGITGIAISHPHYYATVVEWARTFDVPVYLHENDRQWLGRPDDAVQWWSGTTKQVGDFTLINLGVHFPGGTVLHWPGGEGGAGALLSGDIVAVVPDRKFVGFMYSYPNLVPERPAVVRRAAELLAGYPFKAIYGAWWDAVVREDGHEVVQRSAKRYLEFVS